MKNAMAAIHGRPAILRADRIIEHPFKGYPAVRLKKNSIGNNAGYARFCCLSGFLCVIPAGNACF
jgi:hypothetical protein